jgi:hypothetical protein
MGHISTDAMHWRSNTSYSFPGVDAVFKAGALFIARGFCSSTIKALVRAGLDAPERLLFADGADLLFISGLDERGFREIARYRQVRFPANRPCGCWPIDTHVRMPILDLSGNDALGDPRAGPNIVRRPYGCLCQANRAAGHRI